MHLWIHHGYQTLNKFELFWLHSRKISTCQSDKNTEKWKFCTVYLTLFLTIFKILHSLQLKLPIYLTLFKISFTLFLTMKMLHIFSISFTPGKRYWWIWPLTLDLTSPRSLCHTWFGSQIHCFICKHFISNQHEHFRHVCLLWLQNLEWGETKWSGKILSEKSVLLGSPQVSQVEC